jgi:hypothetical protein
MVEAKRSQANGSREHFRGDGRHERFRLGVEVSKNIVRAPSAEKFYEGDGDIAFEGSTPMVVSTSRASRLAPNRGVDVAMRSVMRRVILICHKIPMCTLEQAPLACAQRIALCSSRLPHQLSALR